MRYLTVSFFIWVFGMFLLSGCVAANSQTDAPEQKIVVQKVDREDIHKIMQEEKMMTLNGAEQSERAFGVTGEGIAPLNTISPAQALALAKRAAMADAYRQLGGKLYGVKINAKDTVKDAALKDSKIETQVNALIKNATITETSYKDGLYRVTMELKINEKRWKEVFAY